MASTLKILENFPGIFEILEGNKKVRCILTKHEIPYNEDAISKYTAGKKFLRVYKGLKAPDKFSQKIDVKYKEFFIPSKKSKSRVYCTLTKKEINNIPHEIERCIDGYKFKKAYFYFKEGKLVVEPPKEEIANDDEEDETDKELINDIPFYAASSDEDQVEINNDTLELDLLSGDGVKSESTKSEKMEIDPNENTLNEKNIKKKESKKKLKRKVENNSSESYTKQKSKKKKETTITA